MKPDEVQDYIRERYNARQRDWRERNPEKWAAVKQRAKVKKAKRLADARLALLERQAQEHRNE